MNTPATIEANDNKSIPREKFEASDSVSPAGTTRSSHDAPPFENLTGCAQCAQVRMVRVTWYHLGGVVARRLPRLIPKATAISPHHGHFNFGNNAI